MKKIIHYMSGAYAAAASGLFLILSLVLPILGKKDGKFIAFFTVIIAGFPIVYDAVQKIIFKSGIKKLSSSLLISIAIFASIYIGDVYAAAEIAFLLSIGEIFEDFTVSKVKKGLKNLITLNPVKTRVIKEGREEIVDNNKLEVNDIIRVYPGEVVPADGEIVYGETLINQAVLTGEYLPVDKSVGDDVFGGTTNCFGTFDFKAKKVGNDISLNKILNLVKDIKNVESESMKFIDKISSYLVPLAFCLAILIGVFSKDIEKAVTILVVFCPCALVLATPTTTIAAIAKAAKKGIIIKNGQALENVDKIDVLAFDKTGTLTLGKLKVGKIYSEDFDEKELLELAASVESRSDHPIAKTIVEKAEKMGLNKRDIEKFNNIIGKGVSAYVDNEIVVCGNEDFLYSYNIKISEILLKEAVKIRRKGKITIFIGLNEKCIGFIELEDEIRSNSKNLIKYLKKLKITPMLLTGDNKNTAIYFANTLGINQVKYQLLPEEKYEAIKAKQAENFRVGMVGDGVNDTLALKASNVGVAIANTINGLATEVSDIAVMSNEILDISFIIKLAKRTKKTIKFCITLAILINIIAMILSTMGLLIPVTGAIVHNLGTVVVIGMSAVLYEKNLN